MIPGNIKYQGNRGIYTTGNYDTINILEAIKYSDSYTFNTKFLNPRYIPAKTETAIRELSFVDFRKYLPSEYDINNNTRSQGTYKEFIKEMFDKLTMVIDDRIKDGKYIFLHSAGYDSRLLSGIMAMLRDKGRDMNIHFRCHQPECEDFVKIMQAEGWPKEQYSCWQGPEEDYYDVGRADISVNGFVPYLLPVCTLHRSYIVTANAHILASHP